jgi:hypothetical protein
VWDGASADWQRVLALNAGEIEFFRTAMASEAKFSMPEYNRYAWVCGGAAATEIGASWLFFFAICL